MNIRLEARCSILDIVDVQKYYRLQQAIGSSILNIRLEARSSIEHSGCTKILLYSLRQAVGSSILNIRLKARSSM